MAGSSPQAITQSSVAAGVIDLGIGHPGPELLPMQIMEAAARHRFAAGDPNVLQYGAEAGNPFFRAALAGFLTEQYGAPADPDSLFVTNGVSQALDLICTLWTQPGDTVLVEEPSYFLALRIFADHGLRVVSAPMDDHGLDLNAVAEIARRERPRLLYTIPAYQNPSGVTLAGERRAALVALCRELGMTLVADEVYHLLGYGGAPPPPLAAWAHEPAVLALGSFSKILAPGLRLGWVQAAPANLARLTGSGLLDSGGGLNPFTSALVQSVLELDLLAPYIQRLRAVYARRRMVLAAAVGRECGRRVRVPDGGYFLWLECGNGVDTETLAARAQAAGVGFRAGVKFSSRGGLRSALRLSFAYYDLPELEEGARRLGMALRAS